MPTNLGEAIVELLPPIDVSVEPRVWLPPSDDAVAVRHHEVGGREARRETRRERAGAAGCVAVVFKNEHWRVGSAL